ncbi:hypothetical protein [Solimonas flava]|uniref:hypothetical protein n=1 Tax=Solimonas flava TaxID=415849 RepID=UPI0003FD281B|nr:hypothetical protein [Solimonas flava]
MCRRLPFILPVLAAALACGSSQAGEPAPGADAPRRQALEARREQLARKREAQFRAADRDGDRGLSREELAGSGLPRVLLQRFDAIDRDGDGRLSPEELQALDRERLDSATVGNAVAGQTP